MKNQIILGIGLVIIAVLVYVLFFVKPPSKPQTSSAPIAVPTRMNEGTTNLGTFKGTLPCADCSGLETVITFTKKDTNSAEGAYSMTETYTGKSVKPIETKGDWTTIRGTKKDANATVYQLNPEKPDESEYYLKVDGTHIKMLDKQENEIKSPMNFTLTKQSES